MARPPRHCKLTIGDSLEWEGSTVRQITPARADAILSQQRFCALP